MIKEFSGEDLTVVLEGTIINARSFKYEVKKEVKTNHVLGKREPYDFTSSKKMYTGSLTVPQSEHERLMLSLPSGSDPTDLENISIVANYLSGENLVNDVCESVQITGFGKEMKADGGGMDVTYELNIGNIVFNQRT